MPSYTLFRRDGTPPAATRLPVWGRRDSLCIFTCRSRADAVRQRLAEPERYEVRETPALELIPLLLRADACGVAFLEADPDPDHITHRSAPPLTPIGPTLRRFANEMQALVGESNVDRQATNPGRTDRSATINALVKSGT